jgi:ribosomal protein S18 acetylase RimI-like enzyme
VSSPGQAAGRIRPAAVADADAIAAVHIATWQDAYAGLLPGDVLAGLDVGEWAQRWRNRLADPAEGVFVLVVDEGDRIGGFVSAGPSRDEFAGGEVYTIYVHPGYQGRGAGRRLLQAAMRQLASARFTVASLWVLAGNHPARGFYESQGWHADSTEKPWTHAGGDTATEVRYVKILGAG